MTKDSERVQLLSTKSEPKVILKLALLQMLGTVVFSLVLYFCFDTREALSALFGGLIAALASLFFAGRLFSSKQLSSEQVAADHDLAASEILVRFYFSVALKALLTLALMAVCIVAIKVSMLPFIIAYILAAVIVNWLFLLYRAY